MDDGTPVNSQRFQVSDRMLKLHTYVVASLITILGFCLQLVYANASELLRSSILMMLFVIVVFAYFGSLGVMMLQTDRKFGVFMNKISFLCGTLAVTLELLILLPPFGWLVLFFWIICFVRIATKSYQYMKTLCETVALALVQAFDKLKELIIKMGSGAFDQLKELFGSHEPQDQNRPPV